MKKIMATIVLIAMFLSFGGSESSATGRSFGKLRYRIIVS
jgi:hypothetical protein